MSKSKDAVNKEIQAFERWMREHLRDTLQVAPIKEVDEIQGFEVYDLVDGVIAGVAIAKNGTKLHFAISEEHTNLGIEEG